MLCKHNIEKETCIYCNGDYEAVEKSRYQRKRMTDQIRKLRKEYLAMALEGLDNWGKSYDDAEIDLILTTEYNRVNVYRLAIILERSIKAIKMVYSFAYGRNVIPREYNSWYKQIQNRKEKLGYKDKYLSEFDHLILEDIRRK